MMERRSSVLLMLLMLCVSSVVFAQSSEMATEPVDAGRYRFEKLRAEGFEALYNLDYEGARRRFEEMERLFPDHPAGPQFLAASLWLQTLNKARRLSASLYNTDSFYAKSDDRVSAQTITQFREWTRQAKGRAETRLKRNPRDTEALYFLGATEALKAAFAGTVERRFIAALRDGSSAVDHHREVLKLDPGFHDAELTVGLYDYVVGGLPLPVKLLASIGGVHGSKRRGLEELERVARDGRWARDDAKVILIALYKREKRFTDALALSRELAAKYPRNYLFKLEMADALVSQAGAERQRDSTAAVGADREAFAIFEELLRHEQVPKTDEPAASALDLIHFSYGEALLSAGQPERATEQYFLAATIHGAEPNLATMARLRAAQSLDLTGKRREALAQYRAVLQRPDAYDSHTEAERGLRGPYRKSQLNHAQNEKQ